MAAQTNSLLYFSVSVPQADKDQFAKTLFTLEDAHNDASNGMVMERVQAAVKSTVAFATRCRKVAGGVDDVV